MGDVLGPSLSDVDVDFPLPGSPEEVGTTNASERDRHQGWKRSGRGPRQGFALTEGESLPALPTHHKGPCFGGVQALLGTGVIV